MSPTLLLSFSGSSEPDVTIVLAILLDVLDDLSTRYKMKPRLLGDICKAEHILAPAKVSSFISVYGLYRLHEVGSDPPLV